MTSFPKTRVLSHGTALLSCYNYARSGLLCFLLYHFDAGLRTLCEIPVGLEDRLIPPMAILPRPLRPEVLVAMDHWR